MWDSVTHHSQLQFPILCVGRSHTPQPITIFCVWDESHTTRSLRLCVWVCGTVVYHKFLPILWTSTLLLELGTQWGDDLRWHSKMTLKACYPRIPLIKISVVHQWTSLNTPRGLLKNLCTFWCFYVRLPLHMIWMVIQRHYISAFYGTIFGEKDTPRKFMMHRYQKLVAAKCPTKNWSFGLHVRS